MAGDQYSEPPAKPCAQPPFRSPQTSSAVGAPSQPLVPPAAWWAAAMGLVARGVTGELGALAGPVPRALVAVTVNV